MRSKHVDVTIDLARIRSAAERIRAATGVPLIAIVKSDAYGLGAVAVADALAGVADEYGYFSLDEAREVGRAGIVLGPSDGEPSEYEELKVRPGVGTLDDAKRYARIRSAVHLDTGMQRFGCSLQELPELLRITGSTEVYTHADTRAAAIELSQVRDEKPLFLHAAGTSLLNCPEAWLDAVRPGLALYRGAMRVTTKLLEVREATRPIGYGGFQAAQVGIILVGYAQGLRPAPVMVGGQRQMILEVGMNSAFVSVGASDRPGDDVVLLGGGITEADVSEHSGIREHEVLCRYSGLGKRRYEPA